VALDDVAAEERRRGGRVLEVHELARGERADGREAQGLRDDVEPQGLAGPRGADHGQAASVDAH